jgi:hypothetical protein
MSHNFYAYTIHLDIVKKRCVIINAEKFKNDMAVWDSVLPFSHKGLRQLFAI